MLYLKSRACRSDYFRNKPQNDCALAYEMYEEALEKWAFMVAKTVDRLALK